jgi:ATP-binding protein involved in chromosome partitioning
MLGLQARPVPAEGMMRPVDRYGLAVMSVGFLIEEDQPVIRRGPMVSKVLTEFLGKVDWGERDFLVVDLPPGTGDPSITVARTLPGAAVVMVTTPQAVALADVRRAVLMFRRLGTPVLGVVENMAYFCCAHSAERIPIFGSGCGDALSEELGLPLLASLPIDMALRESGGAGTPLLITEPDAPISCSFTALAARVASILKARG